MIPLMVSMLIGIENHEGKYIPAVSDLKPFLGVEVHASTSAPNGDVRAQTASNSSAHYAYTVSSSYVGTKENCSVIKEICSEPGKCLFQRMNYILVGGSSIGEKNAILNMTYNFGYGRHQSSSSIYFNECFGLSWKNVTNQGVVYGS